MGKKGRFRLFFGVCLPAIWQDPLPCSDKLIEANVLLMLDVLQNRSFDCTVPYFDAGFCLYWLFKLWVPQAHVSLAVRRHSKPWKYEKWDAFMIN